MFEIKKPSRQLPGIFSYITLFSSKLGAYLAFFLVPLIIALAPFLFNGFMSNIWNFLSFIQYFLIYVITSGAGVLVCIIYSRKAPILKFPTKGFSIQLNALITAIIGGSYIIGRFLGLFFSVMSFREIFFMLGTILAYIISFVIYFSFTTVGKPGYLILALTQPVIAIILYSIYTFQLSVYFFIRAVIFFSTCALIFAIPYARGFFQVSNVYKKLTGLGGYSFIRNFVLSMLTEGNDDPIERLFDKVGKTTDIRVQLLFIRNVKNKKLKGLFVIPHVHFGPFKTCGSSIIPERIYNEFKATTGVTVFHTTTDHAYNLTTKDEVNKVLRKIKSIVSKVCNSENEDLKWEDKMSDFTREYFKTGKVLGFNVNNIPIIFLTRHPNPSDDIEQSIGIQLEDLAKSFQFEDTIIIDAHNAIIGDELLITEDSEEASDLIKASRKYFQNSVKKAKLPYEYSTVKSSFDEFSERDGIGKGGMILHFFKNRESDQKTVLIHFDGNNAKVEVRSYILNLLQNRGIEKAEVTTSDSHTVARQFTSRGYSPIGDKIKTTYILQKLDNMIKIAERKLEPVEFLYKTCDIKDVRIWGDQKYFIAIMETLQECINVSQRLLTLSLIIPTFFSIILLIFYYNFPLIRILT
ncbi:MAG: DUF2070 family protein [Candidatus Lokiarchaeota archaeon]